MVQVQSLETIKTIDLSSSAKKRTNASLLDVRINIECNIHDNGLIFSLKHYRSLTHKVLSLKNFRLFYQESWSVILSIGFSSNYWRDKDNRAAWLSEKMLFALLWGICVNSVRNTYDNILKHCKSLNYKVSSLINKIKFCRLYPQ